MNARQVRPPDGIEQSDAPIQQTHPPVTCRDGHPPVISISPRDGAVVTDSPPNNKPGSIEITPPKSESGNADSQQVNNVELSNARIAVEVSHEDRSDEQRRADEPASISIQLPTRNGPPALMGRASDIIDHASTSRSTGRPTDEMTGQRAHALSAQETGKTSTVERNLAGLGTSPDGLQKATAGLRQLIADAKEQSHMVAESSRELQERLVLSARMLKAGQPLLERGEELVTNLKQHDASTEQSIKQLQSTMQDAEQFIEESAAQFESRIEKAAARALAVFDEGLRKRVEEAGRLEQRMADVMDRAEKLAAMVESAEVNITVLAHRAAAMASQSLQEAEQACKTSAHCEEARKLLADDLLAADDRIEQIVARSDEMHSSLHSNVQHAEQVEQGLTRQINRSAQVAEALLQAVQIAEPMLESVGHCAAEPAQMNASKSVSADADAPLNEPNATTIDEIGFRPDVLVESDDATLEVGDMKATPHMLQSMLMQMQQAIASDISRITEALGHVAARVDSIASADSSGSTPQNTDSITQQKAKAATCDDE